jgi:hypothetical protein
MLQVEALYTWERSPEAEATLLPEEFLLSLALQMQQTTARSSPLHRQLQL